jgi:hypothetical protein
VFTPPAPTGIEASEDERQFRTLEGLWDEPFSQPVQQQFPVRKQLAYDIYA